MIKLKRKPAVVSSYNWRPNFRDVESLPELRAVRTKFFIPTVSVSIAVLFGVFIVFQEVRAMNIRENMETLRAEIASYEKKHDEKVSLNAEFMKVTRRLDEVVQFKEGRLIASDYMLTLSSNLREGMYLSRIEFLNGRSTIEGNVQVPAEQASRLVNDYLRVLEEADSLQGLLTEYKLTLLERDSSGDLIKFRIEVSNPEQEEKK